MKLVSMRNSVYRLLRAGRSAASGFFNDDCLTLAASLAFYALFAIPPLIFLLVTFISFGLSVAVEYEVADEWAREFLKRQASDLIGIEVAAAEIGNLIELSTRQTGVWWKSLLSLLGVLVGATGLVSSIQSSLNRVWGVKPINISQFVWKRFVSLVLILGFALLLIVSFLLARIFESMSQQIASSFPIEKTFPTLISQVVNGLTMWTCFSAIFRFMPDAHVSWRHALAGGLLTFLLFMIGQAALFTYLSFGNPAAQLGSAAGSLVVILLWIYYSSSMLLFGAEFTASLSNSNRSLPVPGAVSVEERVVSQ